MISYHLFRRQMQRNYIYVQRLLTLKDSNSSPYENDAIRITTKLVNDKDSTMLISPLSGKNTSRTKSLVCILSCPQALYKLSITNILT